MPRPPFPDERTELLFWLVSDARAIATRPWLPTVTEQDEAWSAVFGELMAQRAATASQPARLRAMFERTDVTAAGPGVDRPSRY